MFDPRDDAPTETDKPAEIGIMMLRTAFTRYLGDIGNAQSWDFPVEFRIVESAGVDMIPKWRRGEQLEDFLQAASALEQSGVRAITTSCGFLSVFQGELADACDVPVVTSALQQVPLVRSMIGRRKKVGILTYDADTLDGPYLKAVGVAEDTPVKGMAPDGVFVRWISQDDNSVSFDALQAEVIATACEFMKEEPELGAIVCECTNLAPFSADIANVLGIPVFDCQTLVNWLHSGVKPRRHHPPPATT